MAKHQNQKNKNHQKKSGDWRKDQKEKPPLLTSKTKRWIKATLMFLVAVIVGLSFWNRAGKGGEMFLIGARFLIGQTVFTIPLLFFLGGLLFLKPKQKGKFLPIFLGIFIFIFGLAGILGAQNLSQKEGGWLGYLMAKLIVSAFGLLVANIIFGAVIIIGLLIFLQSLWQHRPQGEKEAEKKSFLQKIINPTRPLSIRIKEAEGKSEINHEAQPKISLFKNEKHEVAKENGKKSSKGKEQYVFPSVDLLSKNEGSPTSGNIKQSSIIIKKTLENFGIPVEMAEANVGPTVTQYAFKPAEGVKLSKITTLSNNLSLALAAHPIRIEAPIPGKSLVGIEVPNKTRSIVSLRNLIANPLFQSSSAPLLFVLGRNVSGLPMYADMSDMPHLLVAGSTGTGKTIFLNSLILSLLYRNDPGMMKLILIDPKRVEFQHYNHLPHLLCPVIYDAQKTINALSWLVKEMERRFEVFSEIPTRNLDTYNKTKSVINSNSTLPYIVLIIDELADLMAAKGREIEGGVVRLAQMARATGIHLVLATQRPSVEVITGLIKANVTSRTTFQVASQIDSRTVLDMAGAEKLLGAGDMLFVSAKSVRPRRMQAPYVSEEDVKKVSEFIGKQNGKSDRSSIFLAQSLQEQLEKAEEKGGEVFFEGTDPLYEDSKRLILETKKASASFLQRRLKIGYARAARLIDILEEQGFVGPADGAKPREVFGERFGIQADQSEETNEMEGDGEDEEWGKV
ncbi:DNA translocase FtsK [Patescibacteria group bacterium]|nr:DNA translocase FtsK [Patescibacteria group bacterium]MBU4367493.1 DNA translocase FtsK [Patescibacteria group bacterium]MBU4461985.1 DNA translocase FtsK [Patescibacteria group bacterium]MCG2700485.1 DNA translocase FtsK [Candidatus Parcubacteria bacterium]